ncbi:CGNR zinc finger domain-containing protein [Helicovermis profundi]|uniref:ABATE domain-containing protein n=1 Tax=Helicovermis profundi TaxID=3065157 RepID=A0AAU9E5C6_9FIRM|nr:ABATE domain-containing protein [Clostridia bacterium S502]
MKYLCIEFINTEWYNFHEMFKEPLKDEKLILDFFNSWNIDFKKPLQNNQIEILLDLRDLLKKIIYSNCKNEKIDLNDFRLINNYMASYEFKKNIVFENGEYNIIEVLTNSYVNLVVYKIISSFFDLVSENKLSRINYCKNPDCNWLFYDESKNKTRKWCDNTCASLMKVRKYRNKLKSSNNHLL